MTDDERAKHVWHRVCEAAEYAKHAGITGTALYALMGNTCLKETEAAFAALREECATECREDTAALRRDRDMLWGQVFERDKIIDGLRTAQPSGINVPGLGRLTESPEGEWTDEPR
jgi:predicted amino acid dehydrogenase